MRFSFPQSFSEVIKNLAVVLPHYVLNKGNILMVWIARNFKDHLVPNMLQHSFSITVNNRRKKSLWIKNSSRNAGTCIKS